MMMMMMSSSSTPPPSSASTSGSDGRPVTELELIDLAEKIDVNAWRKVGLWLDIRESALSKYERENWFSGASSTGTYKMLCDWKKNCPDLDQRQTLCVALQRCDLTHLANEVLKETAKGLFGPDIVPIRSKLISFAKTKLLRVPLIPWAKSSYIQVDAIFISVQLVLHITGPDIPIRCPLESYNDMISGNISDEPWDGCTKRFLVRGKAGSGKTTLLVKLLSDWCKEVAGALLAKFKLVFFIPMRKLTFQSNLGEAIVQHCLPRDAKISQQAVEQICHENAKDVFVLLDGYDEFPGKGLEGEDPGNIVSMLRNEEFIDVHVMVTTRPGRLDDFLEFGDYKHIEVTGFTPQHVREYIDNTFTGKRQHIGTNLYAYLEGNNLLAEVSSVPLLLCAFCQVAKWTDGNEFGKLSTYTALFLRLVRCFFEHELAKPKSASNEGIPTAGKQLDRTSIMSEEFLFDQLGKVALLGFFRPKDGELLFSHEDFDKCSKSPSEVIDQGCLSGILTKDDDVSFAPWEDQYAVRNISFVLKTVQEMFAGRYFARLVEQKEFDIFRYYLQSLNSVQSLSDLANVLLFACGQSLQVAEEVICHVVHIIIEEDAGVIEKFWKGQLPIQECRKVQQMVELCLNLNYESQCKGKLNKFLQPLFRMIRLFSPTHRTAKTLGYLLKHCDPARIDGTPPPERRHSNGFRHAGKLEENIDVDGACLSMAASLESRDSNEGMLDATENRLNVTTLEIIHVNKMFDDQFRQLRDFLPKVKNDFFRNVNNLAMTQADTWSSIRKRLTKKNPETFEDIDHLSNSQFIAYLPIREELKKWQANEIYLDDVLDGLTNCTVETLVITGNSRKSNKWCNLLESLRTSSEWDILVKLDVSRNNLPFHVMSSLARALDGKVNLQHLDVSGNEIKTGFVSILPALPNLRRIYLNSEHMEPQALSEFGGKLKGFPQIEVIDLNNNPLDDSAAAEIGDALSKCSEVKRLRLDVSKVSEGGIRRLVAKIKFVPSLTHLGLYKHHKADALLMSATVVISKVPGMVSLSLTCRLDEELGPDQLTVRLTTAQSFTKVIVTLPKLEVVELFNMRFCAEGLLGLLEAFKTMSNLREFRLAAGSLPDDQEVESACRQAQQSFLKVY